MLTVKEKLVESSGEPSRCPTCEECNLLHNIAASAVSMNNIRKNGLAHLHGAVSSMCYAKIQPFSGFHLRTG